MSEKRTYSSYTWGMHLLLCIVTFGVWNYIWIHNTTKYLNDVSEAEDRIPMAETLLCLFVPFYSIFWYYTHSKKTEAIYAEKGLSANNLCVITLLFSIFLPGIVPLAYLQSKLDVLYAEGAEVEVVEAYAAAAEEGVAEAYAAAAEEGVAEDVPTKKKRISAFRLALDRFGASIKQFLIKIKFDKWKGWVYLAPCIALLLVFTGWPIVNTLAMAFQNGYDMFEWIGGANFTFGIENFKKVIEYGTFWDCMKNTVLLCVLTVPISTFVALVIAVCLNSIKFLSRFLQTVYFLPYVTNSIAIGMVFAAMFNMVGTAFGGENEIIQSAGIVNNILGLFGVDPINWINEGSGYWENMFVMVFYIVWNALPFKILILLGGLQSVNKQYYDAAKIDSTPKWRVFTKITVPLLSPMIAYVVITGFIGGFKEYSSIVGIFGDDMGPTGKPRQLNTMVGYIYNFIDQRQGQASAAALILFGIIFLVTMVNLYVSKKKTHF